MSDEIMPGDVDGLEIPAEALIPEEDEVEGVVPPADEEGDGEEEDEDEEEEEEESVI